MKNTTKSFNIWWIIMGIQIIVVTLFGLFYNYIGRSFPIEIYPIMCDLNLISWIIAYNNLD